MLQGQEDTEQPYLCLLLLPLWVPSPCSLHKPLSERSKLQESILLILFALGTADAVEWHGTYPAALSTVGELRGEAEHWVSGFLKAAQEKGLQELQAAQNGTNLSSA